MEKIYGVLFVLGLMLLAYGPVLLSSPAFVALSATTFGFVLVNRIEYIMSEYIIRKNLDRD